MDHAIPMQILEPQYQLPEILPGLLDPERRFPGLLAHLDVHKDPTGHVFQYEVQRVRIGDRDGFGQFDNLGISDASSWTKASSAYIWMTVISALSTPGVRKKP
jgi:hypothetical protein